MTDQSKWTMPGQRAMPAPLDKAAIRADERARIVHLLLEDARQYGLVAEVNNNRGVVAYVLIRAAQRIRDMP